MATTPINAVNIDAYLFSGRCVASAYEKTTTTKSGNVRGYFWRDTRDTGGVYERLEDWMRIVKLEHANETVSFRMRIEKP